jgi:predicted transcriptional regulator
MKKLVNFRLSDEGRAMLRTIARKLALSQCGVIESLIREKIKREKIEDSEILKEADL